MSDCEQKSSASKEEIVHPYHTTVVLVAIRVDTFPTSSNQHMRRLIVCLFTTVSPSGRRYLVGCPVNVLSPTRNSHPRRRSCPWPRCHSTTRQFSSSTSEEASAALDFSISLPDRLKEAFAERHTDGVREVISAELSRSEVANPDAVSAATSWINAIGHAVPSEQSGNALSMLNGCLAATVAQNGDTSQLALELLQWAEEKFAPGVLTYSLAYTAVDDESTAAQIMKKAQHRSKKLAGSSRRKALAAARRKSVAKAHDGQDKLQALLGPDFAVLMETDDFVVVNKPAGTVCCHAHLTTSGKTGRKNADVSLVDALLHVNVPLSTINPEAQGLVHRLDRGTSGVCILAKTDHMHALLVAEFFLRRVQKTYHTLVAPCPRPLQGSLDLPVGGRPARSDYSVIRQRGDDLAMVEMKTFTGRKHQGELPMKCIARVVNCCSPE